MRFDLPSFLTGSVTSTAIMAAITIAQPMQVSAKTAKEVAQVAVPTTVRIDNPLGSNLGGSGVIIAKNGNTYTVLTCNHVVKSPNLDYKIYTSKKKSYKVTQVTYLPSTAGDLDLALVKFESPEEQAVAPISDSDEAGIGSGVYISGYPMSIETEGEREYEFTNGQVSSRPDKRAGGYTMRYTAVTRRGMSGGPVFDVSGRVVGIHGQGDREKESSAAGVEIKTGLNAAVPVNSFTAVLSSLNINKSDLAFDNAKPDDTPTTQPTRQEVKSWEQDFALAVGVGVLRQFIPVPSFIPGFRF
jgi:serine protease Do